MSGYARWTDLIFDLGRSASNDRLRPDQFREPSSAVAILDHVPTGGCHRLFSTSSRSKVRAHENQSERRNPSVSHFGIWPPCSNISALPDFASQPRPLYEVALHLGGVPSVPEGLVAM